MSGEKEFSFDKDSDQLKKYRENVSTFIPFMTFKWLQKQHTNSLAAIAHANYMSTYTNGVVFFKIYDMIAKTEKGKDKNTIDQIIELLNENVDKIFGDLTDNSDIGALSKYLTVAVTKDKTKPVRINSVESTSTSTNEGEDDKTKVETSEPKPKNGLKKKKEESLKLFLLNMKLSGLVLILSVQNLCASSEAFKLLSY